MRASKDCVPHLNVTGRITRDKRDGKPTAPQHNPGMMLERAKECRARPVLSEVGELDHTPTNFLVSLRCYTGSTAQVLPGESQIYFFWKAAVISGIKEPMLGAQGLVSIPKQEGKG